MQKRIINLLTCTSEEMQIFIDWLNQQTPEKRQRMAMSALKSGEVLEVLDTIQTNVEVRK